MVGYVLLNPVYLSHKQFGKYIQLQQSFCLLFSMDKMGAWWVRLKSAFLRLHLRIKLCLSFVPVMTRRFTQSQGYYFSVGGAFFASWGHWASRSGDTVGCHSCGRGCSWQLLGGLKGCRSEPWEAEEPCRGTWVSCTQHQGWGALACWSAL